jgi:hypothetical protein
MDLDGIFLIISCWFIFATFIICIGTLFLNEDSRSRILSLRESSNPIQKINLFLFSCFPLVLSKILASFTLILFICLFILIIFSGIEPSMPPIILAILLCINSAIIYFVARWLFKYSKNPNLDISNFGYDRGFYIVLAGGIPKMAYTCFYIIFNLFILLELYRIIFLIEVI